MTGRIVRSADFERVLRLSPRAKSAHFALHHLRAEPLRFVPKRAVGDELSTAPVVNPPEPVDDIPVPVPRALWLGTVVPKRHAKRSVTRSLMKRQMHAAFDRTERLPGGLWVLRLRSGFDVKQFPSAASDALRRHVRDELDALIAGLASRLQAPERAT